MSDWGTSRDTDRPTLIERVARWIAAHPGETGAALVAAHPDTTAASVKGARAGLIARGFVRGERRHGLAGRIHGNARCYYATPYLLARLRDGLPIAAGRRPMRDDDDDDGWQPPVHYIGATRAAILGLRRGAA